MTILFEYYTIKGFIDFCNERESIRFKREQNHSSPLTKDKILRTKKFCNIDRNHDRGTKVLFKFLSTLSSDYDKILFCLTYRHLSSGYELLNSYQDFNSFDSYIEHLKQSKEKLKLGSVAYQLRLYQDFTAKDYVLNHINKHRNKIVSFILKSNQISFNDFINNMIDIMQFKTRLKFINLQFALDIVELFPNVIDKDSPILWGVGSETCLKQIANQENISIDETLSKLKEKTNFHQIVLEHALCEYDKYCKYIDGSKDFNKKVKTYKRTNDLINEW